MSSDDEGWFPWPGGPPPDTGGRKVVVRLRCRTRKDALAQEPQAPSYWRDWIHRRSPGDIVEWRHA